MSAFIALDAFAPASESEHVRELSKAHVHLRRLNRCRHDADIRDGANGLVPPGEISGRMAKVVENITRDRPMAESMNESLLTLLGLGLQLMTLFCDAQMMGARQCK